MNVKFQNAICSYLFFVLKSSNVKKAVHVNLVDKSDIPHVEQH